LLDYDIIKTLLKQGDTKVGGPSGVFWGGGGRGGRKQHWIRQCAPC
jgi:hypothetical protein